MSANADEASRLMACDGLSLSGGFPTFGLKVVLHRKVLSKPSTILLS
jgi:hypothetical protein